MGLFDIFKSRKKKELEYLEALYSVSCKVFDIVKKKKNYSDIGVTIDLNFDSNMFDKFEVLNYYKNGVLDVFGERYKKSILKVITADEIDNNCKIDIELLFNYFESYTENLEKAIVEKRKNL